MPQLQTKPNIRLRILLLLFAASLLMFAQQRITDTRVTYSKVKTTQFSNESICESQANTYKQVELLAEHEPAQTQANYYTESDIVMLAKVLYNECGPYGALSSDTEKACVVWTVLNRVDAWNSTIADVITAPNQFAYKPNTPTQEEHYNLSLDVLQRWNAEKNGETDVGRVLPKDYLWFSGDCKHNYFRNAYKGNYTKWDYSLPTPYES